MNIDGKSEIWYLVYIHGNYDCFSDTVSDGKSLLETVTTRNITFLVGDPEVKPSLAAIASWVGEHPNIIHAHTHI